jgi:lysophospholipase L1-like esterase
MKCKILALALISGIGVRGQGGGDAMQQAQGGDSATLRGLIVDYFNAVSAKDFVRLDALVTRDFIIYEAGSAWNNDSVFRNIQQHQPFDVRFTLSDFHIFTDVRSGDLRCHEHAEFVVLDTVKFALDFVETAMFRKTAAGWKLSLIDVTPEQSPVVTAPGYYRAFDTLRYIPDHYRGRVEEFGKETARHGGIVFLGNSITEFGKWKLLLGDSAVVNRGIAGDNTFGMLHRLDQVIALRPAKLFVEAGINDLGQGVPVGMIAGNIGSIVQYVRVKSPGTRVFVLSVLPTNDRAKEDYPEVYGKNAVASELDRRLKGEAEQYGFVYIDLAARVADGNGNLKTEYAQPDGLHLNEAGYRLFLRLAKEMRCL